MNVFYLTDFEEKLWTFQFSSRPESSQKKGTKAEIKGKVKLILHGVYP